MRHLLPLFLVVLIIQTSVAPPVEKKNEDHKDKENEVDDADSVGIFLGFCRFVQDDVIKRLLCRGTNTIK